MGQLIDKQPTKPFDKGLVHTLKHKNLADLNECIEIVNQEYSDCTYLTFQQFEDIFCGLLNDTEPYFLQLQNDHDLKKTVDLFESIACFTIFCGDKFEDKLLYIFRLFDFDRSGTIEKNELVMTLQSAVRAICKIVNIDPPTMKQCEETADAIFDLIDHDGNKKISLKEFTFWVTNNQEIQDFLLKYANTQTFENLEKRFTQLKVFYKYLFDRCGDSDSQCVPIDDLKILFIQECKATIPIENINFLFDLFVNTSNQILGPQNAKLKLIDRQAYNNIMRAWCAFSSADINNDDSLASKELGNLLWIYENQQPDPVRVQQELRILDKDKSQSISRIEWMKNLCAVDSKGKTAFAGDLFKLFEKYDKDNSGYLTKDEIKLLLGDVFKDYSRRVENLHDASKTTHYKEMLLGLEEEIVTGLETDGDGMVSWEEFKKFMEVSYEKQEKLKKFIEDNLLKNP